MKEQRRQSQLEEKTSVFGGPSPVGSNHGDPAAGQFKQSSTVLSIDHYQRLATSRKRGDSILISDNGGGSQDSLRVNSVDSALDGARNEKY